MDQAAEQQLISDVLQYCQDRAIIYCDEETNNEHMRTLWNEVVAKFKDRYEGDIMDVLSDYSLQIQDAMFESIVNKIHF